jgi:hypothetical protein
VDFVPFVSSRLRGSSPCGSQPKVSIPSPLHHPTLILHHFIILPGGPRTGLGTVGYLCILYRVWQRTRRRRMSHLAATQVCSDQAPLLQRSIRVPTCGCPPPKTGKTWFPSLGERARAWNGSAVSITGRSGTPCLTLELRSRCHPLRPTLSMNHCRCHFARQSNTAVLRRRQDSPVAGNCPDFRASENRAAFAERKATNCERTPHAPLFRFTRGRDHAFLQPSSGNRKTRAIPPTRRLGILPDGRYRSNILATTDRRPQRGLH